MRQHSRLPSRAMPVLVLAAAAIAGVLLGVQALSQSGGSVWHDWREIQNVFVEEHQVDRTEICTINGISSPGLCPSYCKEVNYKGMTPTQYAGNMGGYEGAATLCSSEFGDPWTSYHMCTAEEIARAAQCGEFLQPPLGWYSSGDVDTLTNGEIVADCKGWTSSGQNQRGPVWLPNAGDGEPSRGTCDTVRPILCCQD